MNNKILDTFYSKNGRKHSIIFDINEFLYIEFYHDDVLISGVELKDHNIYYAQSVAENFCNDILKIDPWRDNESIKSDLHKSCNQ